MIDPDIAVLALISVGAFVTALIQGTVGLAGGTLMVAMLTHFLGIKQAVPTMVCALIICHASRVVLYWSETDWNKAARILVFGGPAVILGASEFRILSSTAISTLFVGMLVFSFPIKYWARRKRIHTGPKTLSAASVIWGMLAGNVIGQGFFLAPFLLGTGISRHAFVGTLATVTLVIGLLRVSVFGVSGVLTEPILWLGILIGVISVPGSWIGRRILNRLSDTTHRIMIDGLTVILIVNFLYVGFRTE